jgi:hypothetical protein
MYDVERWCDGCLIGKVKIVEVSADLKHALVVGDSGWLRRVETACLKLNVGGKNHE